MIDLTKKSYQKEYLKEYKHAHYLRNKEKYIEAVKRN